MLEIFCGAIHVAIRVAKCWNNSSKSPEVNTLNDGEYIFYAANGASNTDLFIVIDSITSWNFYLYTDTEFELFIGYANRGHVPVHVNFVIPTRRNIRETKFDHVNADWDQWREVLEEEAGKKTDPANPIYKNADETLLTISKLLEEVNQLCNLTKICSVYSKPFCNTSYELKQQLNTSSKTIQPYFDSRKSCSSE